MEENFFSIQGNMESSEFYPSVSIIVSHILNNIGVNEEIIKKRRNVYLQNEAVRAICNNLSAKYANKTMFEGVKIYHFGSQIEGTTTKGLGSDQDMLQALNLRDIFMFEMTINILESVQDNTPEGHYRLPVPYYLLGRQFLWYYTKSGSCFLPNSLFFDHVKISQDDYLLTLKHGPSMYRVNVDLIPAFKLSKWPTRYLKMLSRFRFMVWPTEKLLKKIEKTDKFLVPVGYAESEFSFLEWRISPSLAERMLIFSFNVTQIQCLTLLKLIKKHFFEPEVGDCFTSYHCKTVMFYTMTRTHSSLWTNDNLMRCITSCLFTLHMFLKYRFCPQFFNPNLNLFVGKMNPQAYRILLDIVHKFLKGNLRCLLQVKRDCFGEQLRVILEMSCNHSFNTGLRNILKRNDNKEIIVNIVMDRIKNYQEFSFFVIFGDMRSYTLKKICRQTLKILRKLLTIIKAGDEIERQGTKSFLPFICTNLASFLSSYRIKKKQPITRDIVDLYRIGFQADSISTRLKLASALVCAKQYDEAFTIVEETRTVYSTECMHICYTYIPMVPFDIKQFYEYAFGWLDKNQCNMAFTHCVKFHRQEIWCCPLGLRWSVLEATCDNNRLMKLQDKQIALLKLPLDANDLNQLLRVESEVDAYFLLCYLEFLIYRIFKEPDKVKQSLDNLIKYLNANPTEWEKYFFDLVPKETDDLVLEHNKLVTCYPDKEIDKFHMAIYPKTNKNIKELPFGSIGLCVSSAFRKFCRVQHMDMTLNIVGYALETVVNTRTAYAFYWMAYLVKPSLAAHRHLLRQHLFRETFQKILFSCWVKDKTLKHEAELCLLSHLSYSLVMMIDKCKRVQKTADIFDTETNREKAIRFCMYFATLIMNYKKLPKSTEKHSPSLLFIESHHKTLKEMSAF